MNNAITSGDEWIKANCDEDCWHHHPILQGWCLLLSQTFLLNYSYFCRVIYGKMVLVIGDVPFTLKDMLSKVGLEATKYEVLYLQCMKYDLSLERNEDCDCRLCESDTKILITTATLDRPIQEMVLNNPLDERGTIALRGKGWTRKLCSSWFCHTNSKTKSNKKASITKSNGADSLDDKDEESTSVTPTEQPSDIKKKKKSQF